jgi:hypothetical protein
MDVINDYVSKALIADNRGGLNVEKIYNEKLKEKYLRIKGSSNNRSNTTAASIDPFRRAKTVLKYNCSAPKQDYRKKRKRDDTCVEKRKRILIKKYKKALLSQSELQELHNLWNEYWNKSVHQNNMSKKNFLQRIRRGLIFTGSRMKVIGSRCPQDIGTYGYVVKETCNTFIFQNEKTICKDFLFNNNITIRRKEKRKEGEEEAEPNNYTSKYGIKMIPKSGRTFLLYLPVDKNKLKNNNRNILDTQFSTMNKTMLLYGDDFVIETVINKTTKKQKKQMMISTGDMYTMI